MLNNVTMIGRVGKDPEERLMPNGQTVVSFSLANDDPFTKNHTNWFNVSVFGQNADYTKTYVTKGRLIAITGRLRQRKWTTQEGQNRDAVEIVADRVEGLDRPKDGTVTVTAASPTPDYDPFAE